MARVVLRSTVIRCAPCILAVAALVGVGRGGPRTTGVIDTEKAVVKFELVSRQPMPFEAVRVRVVLTNPTEDEQWCLRPIDPRFRIQGPGSSGFQDVRFTERLLDPSPWDPVAQSRRRYFDERLVRMQGGFHLGPKQQMSLCRPLATTLQFDEAGERPLFPRPGRYVLEYVLPEAHYKGAQRTLQLPITVAEPTGLDARALQYLKDHPTVYEFIIFVTRCRKRAFLSPLEEFVKKYAATPYADYARFALARSYLMGTGLRLLGVNESDELWADLIRGTLERIESPAQRRVELIREHYGEAPLPADWKNAIDEVVLLTEQTSARDRKRAIDRLAALVKVSDDERARALAHLTAIKSRRFAYYPHAKALQWRVIRETAPDDAEAIRDDLNRYFPDSLRWMEEFDRNVLPQAPRGDRVTLGGLVKLWQKYRKRIPDSLPDADDGRAP